MVRCSVSNVPKLYVLETSAIGVLGESGISPKISLGLINEAVSQSVARSLLKEISRTEGLTKKNRVMLGDCGEWKLWGRHPLTFEKAGSHSFGGTESVLANSLRAMLLGC